MTCVNSVTCTAHNFTRVKKNKLIKNLLFRDRSLRQTMSQLIGPKKVVSLRIVGSENEIDKIYWSVLFTKLKKL